jgi:hypothetical protein
MEVSMSWHDVARIDEPAEESALRGEIQNMLGLAPAPRPNAESSPEAVALAQSLYREAMRRRRTSAVVKPLSKRPFFIIAAAAALPVLFAVGALGTWGVKQKRRADALAAKTLELESKQNRIDAAREGLRNREPQPLLQASEPNANVSPDSKPGRTTNTNGELVKPEEQPSRLNSRPEQYRVNDAEKR